MSNAFSISVIIPCYEEQSIVHEVLDNIRQTLPNAEVIVVDASSSQQTMQIVADEFPDVIYHKAVGDGKRSTNMNQGAAIATGDVLLFHHADSRLPQRAERVLDTIDRTKTPYGGFIRTMRPALPATRVADRFGKTFIHWFGYFLGDNSIFITREYFTSLGGYWSKPLFEDVELMQRARKRLCRGQTRAIISDAVEVSSRKFIEYGQWKMYWMMLGFQVQYFLGVSVERIEKKYMKYGKKE